MQLAVAFGSSMLANVGGIAKIGWLVGSVAGSFLGGNKEKNASKLSDLKISSSTYGKGVPIGFGTMRYTGNMIWATDIVEKKKYIGMKGKDKTGKKKDDKKGTETYEYFGNFAMALCEGTKADVLRIWCDSNLIYDKMNPDNEDLVEPGFSQGDNDSGGKLGNKSTKKGGASGRWSWRFYPGNESQTQDPFMVKTQGAANVPAFRGTCYLMFEDFPLADFGNRIPTITAEVVDKKERKLHVQFYPWMDDDTLPEELRFDKAGRFYRSAYIDPIRQRLYTILDGYVCCFDITKGKETHRFIAEHQVIGIGGEGDLIGVSGATNSRPIHWMDPNTGVTLRTLGVESSSLGATYYPIDGLIAKKGYNFPAPTHATPFPIATLDGLEWSTLIQSIFGQFYLISGDEVFGTNNGQPGRVIPGPTSLGQLWYVMYENKIFKFDGHRMSYGPNGKKTTLGSVDTDWCNLGSVLEIPHPVDGSGNRIGTVTMQPPIYIAGADAWMVLYSINGDNQGSYVNKYDQEFKECLWSAKVHEDPIGWQLINTFWGYYDPIPIVEGNKWAYATTGLCHIIDVKMESIESFLLPYGTPIGPSAQFFISNMTSILGWGSFDGKTGWWLVQIDKYEQSEVDVADIVRTLSIRAGIPDEKIDTSEMEPSAITGYIIESPTAARNAIEDLTQLYFFDGYESDYTLKYRTRGIEPLVTIQQEDLGVIGEADSHDYYKETRSQEIDLPQTVIVSFINAKKDYETMSQHYRRPSSPMSVMQSREQIDVNLPIALRPVVAKKMAEKILYGTWAERVSHEFILPWEYLIYDPTDVFRFEMDDGLVFNERVLKSDIGADYTIELGTVSQFGGVYDAIEEGMNAGGVIPGNKTYPPLVVPLILDIPFTSDADAGDGAGAFPLYWGAGSYAEGFQAGGLLIKDDPGDYEAKGNTIYEAIWGRVIGEVPAPPHGVWVTDDQTEIHLLQMFDYEEQSIYQWESIDDALWPSEDNMILIGNEIILFRDVEVDDETGIVTISHLIRGWRGTENTSDDSQATNATKWVLVKDDTLKIAELSGSSLGEDLVAKMVSSSLFQGFASVTQFNYKANALRPWAPYSIFREDVDGDAEITWNRRTRFNGSLQNGTGSVPLNEGTESYVLFITSTLVDPDDFNPYLESSYIRRVELTTPEWSYTDAMLTADGKIITDPIHVVLYQMSDVVGYGFPASATLETTVAAYKS